jgi:hypothetical protein
MLMPFRYLIRKKKQQKGANQMSSDKNKIFCDKCDILEKEDELIGTFDNELLCSACYVKKELIEVSDE